MRSTIRLALVVGFLVSGVNWLPAQNDCVCNGFSASRAERGFSPINGSEFSRFRTILTDPAYFGSGAVVARPVRLGAGLEGVSTGTLAGSQVFFTGWTPTSSYTNTEKTALLSAVNGGLNLVLTADDLAHNIADIFGVTLVEGNNEPEMNTVVAAEHPIFAGPFGRVTQFRGAGIIGHFRSWPEGTVVLAANSIGPTMLLIPRGTLSVGAGAVLLTSDTDQFTTYNRTIDINSSEPSLPVTDALVLNLVSFLCNPTIPSSAPHLVFPQFANGQNNVSSLNLTNTDIVGNVGTVKITGNNGSPYAPNIIGHGAASSFGTGSVPANQTLTYTTDGVGTLKAGTVTVRGSTPNITGNVMFYVPGLGATGVGASEVAGGFVIPVVNQPTGTVPIEVYTGLAMSNMGAKAADIRLELWDDTGRRGDGTVRVTMPAYGHSASFLYELFPSFDFRGFKGTLRVVSNNVLLAVTGLQLGSSAGQFTALPVKAIFR
jgi:hypothetical protein